MTGWILEKCEHAWATYLSGSITSSTVNVYRGNEEVEKDGPAIICFAESADEVEVGTGVYRVSVVLHLAVPYNGSGSLDTRNQIAHDYNQRVYGNTNIRNDLTGSVSEIGIFALYFQAHNNGFEGDSWVSNNLIEMVVAHS